MVLVGSLVDFFCLFVVRLFGSGPESCFSVFFIRTVESAVAKILFYFSNDSSGACDDSPGLLFGEFAVHFPGAGDFAGPDFHPSRTQYFSDRTDGAPALPGKDVERPGRRTGSDDECTFAFLPGLRKAESRFAHENRNEPLEEHLQPR